MVKFDFQKILKLSTFNQQFFSLAEQDTGFKKFLKFIFLFVFSPIYLFVTAIIYALYFSETLLTIPSKLVNGIRTQNTPKDEKNLMPFNVTYVILYLFVVPFDTFAILTSWNITLLSLFADFIGNIVCLGNRHLSAFELCFDNNESGETFSKKHFWLTLLGVVLLIAIFVIGVKLSTSIATGYETINAGLEKVKVEKFDQDLHDVLYYIFIAIAYLLPTTVLTIVYNKKGK